MGFSVHVDALNRRLASRSTLDLLARLVRNVAVNPHEQKFRRIRSNNSKIKSELLEPGGGEAEALLALLGFEATIDAEERAFVLRDAALDTARLRMGLEM